jgi:hypothetical protein
MEKLTDMRFFQVLKYPSRAEADMQKIEEYYEEFIKVLFHTSKTPNDLIDFYNQQCYVCVELKDLVNDLDYIDQHLPKNKCIKKALELLEMQLSLTESRLKPSFENYTQQTSTNSNVNPKIKWTGSNVELVELGYAMLATRSINDGYIGINEIMDFLCSVFDFPVKDYYHVYHTIKQRAGDRTIYLDKMKDRLMNKMDNDENKK